METLLPSGIDRFFKKERSAWRSWPVGREEVVRRLLRTGRTMGRRVADRSSERERLPRARQAAVCRFGYEVRLSHRTRRLTTGWVSG